MFPKIWSGVVHSVVWYSFIHVATFVNTHLFFPFESLLLAVSVFFRLSSSFISPTLPDVICTDRLGRHCAMIQPKD